MEISLNLKGGTSLKHKTGNWASVIPVRDEKKCIKCKLCAKLCPEACIKDDLSIDYDYCKGCGICAEICPVKAIKMVKK